MPILSTRKYKCNQCGNTFVTTEGDVLTTNLTCQECGGTLKTVELDLTDRINPLEGLKSARHTLKSLYNSFVKKD